jgi:hypothetical protein
MFIDKYKTHSGYEKDGCFYEDGLDCISSGFLQFCGCGDPEDSCKLVLKWLKLIEKDMHNCLKLNSNKSVNQFILYQLTSLDLIEHGGSVYGSRLTDLGKNIIADLEILLK